MFDQPGISMDDLHWIHHDQFTHYLALARPTRDQPDRTIVRGEVLAALTAAFGLDTRHGSVSPAQQIALDVVDDVSTEHDPATSWHDFTVALWHRRHAIRPDLP